jgi:hypothetical protein
MIPITLEIPSEYNKFNIVAESGKPLNNSGKSFEFYDEDDCGQLTTINITPFDFVMNVYDVDCLVYTITDLVKVAPNMLYIDVTSLDVAPGDYDYKIEIVNNNTVISGKLTVK